MRKITALASLMLLIGVVANASITTTGRGFWMNATPSTNKFFGAEVGDFFVVLTAPNKKATAASFTSTLGSGSTAGLQLVSSLESSDSVNYTTWGWVYSVTNRGIIESVISASAANSTSGGRFLLHSDNGTLALGDTSVLTMDGGSGPEYWTNNYSWVAADDAVVMETIAGNAEGLDWDKTTIVRANAGTNQVVQYKDGLGSLSAYENDLYTDASANWRDASTLGVVITETVPEPATLGMIGLVGGFLLFIRRRFMI